MTEKEIKDFLHEKVDVLATYIVANDATGAFECGKRIIEILFESMNASDEDDDDDYSDLD